MRLYWTLAFCFSLIGSQAQTFETPLDYLKFINKEFVALQDVELAYQAALAYQGEAAAEQKRQAVFKRVDLIDQRLQGVAAYANDHNLLQNARSTAALLKTIGKKNYEQLAIQTTGCTDCFATMQQQVNLDQADKEELGNRMAAMVEGMKHFAADHNIQFSTDNNPRNALLRRLQRLQTYLQAYNLAVGEVQYANNAVIDALNNRDIDAGKAAAAALVEASANAVKRLSKTPRLADDGAYFTATRQLIDAYRKAGQYLYPTMLERFDAEGKLPNDQVDAYNKNIDVLNSNLQTLTDQFFAAEQALRQQETPAASE